MVNITRDERDVEIPHNMNTEKADMVEERRTTVVICLTSDRWPREMAPTTEKEFRSAIRAVPSTGGKESEALYDER